MLYVLALDAASQLAALAAQASQARRLHKKADRLRNTCRRLFWDPNQQAYVDNFSDDKPGTHVTRHAASLAILSGVAQDDQLPAILRNALLNSSVTPMGTPYMTAFQASALARTGRVGEMLDLIRSIWCGMLDAGASTFWEAWRNAHEAFNIPPSAAVVWHGK